MTNTIQQIAGSIGTGLITILSTASNFQPTMSDYQGMDKKMAGQIQIDAMLHGYHSGFYLPLLLHSSVYCLHF